MAGLISFGPLEDMIHGVVETNKELTAQVQQLQTTLATMASKEELAACKQLVKEKDAELDKFREPLIKSELGHAPAALIDLRDRPKIDRSHTPESIAQCPESVHGTR